jgi:hypothetical protein
MADAGDQLAPVGFLVRKSSAPKPSPLIPVERRRAGGIRSRAHLRRAAGANLGRRYPQYQVENDES